MLQTLSTLGYVNHREDKTYAATLKTWQVGRSLIENLNLRELASPEMQQLSNETGETIYLAVQEGLSVVYIDKIDSQKPIRSWNPIGGSAPLHSVGTGKAILAINYASLRNSIEGHLTPYTDLTLTNLSALDEDGASTLERGYAVDQGEYRQGIKSFGAAILLPDKAAIAALGISVPEVNLPEGGEQHFGALVAEAARSVSSKISKS